VIKPDLTVVVPATLGRVHFVGIGGSGMSGIAHMFLDRGIAVSGSDRDETPYMQSLRDRGATVVVGHDAANVGNADTIVFTSALWETNPEYLEAKARGLTLLHRSQALVWLTRGQRLVTVAGAHGKTTSTGMLVTALRGLQQSPSFVNGGIIKALGASSASGSGELFVIEADESDGSFQLYDTSAALITNVDPAHLDHYGTPENFIDAFIEFCQKAPEFVVASSDDKPTQRVLERLVDKRVITFGVAEHADVRITDIDSEAKVGFTLHYRGVAYRARLDVPGAHNAINAAGAFATLVELGFDPAESLEQLGTFGGTKRRFELKGEARGVRVYDDYAHEPLEAAAAVSGARTVVGSGRVIAVHQPHLYSRTKLRSAEFAGYYEKLADYTIVVKVDGAREDPVEGVTGELVWNGFTDKSRVAYKPDWDDAAREVARVARAGDIVMTLSCGDVYKLVPQLLEALETTAESGDELASVPS
jgi:UDP-N-acetylmuramate--alanine ligase